MAFESHPGFTITRYPDRKLKNSARNFRNRLAAPRQPVRGDLTEVKAEQALWLRPTNKYRGR